MTRAKSQTLGKRKNRKRAKTHGFLVRARTPGGKRIVKRRRQKGRKRLAA